MILSKHPEIAKLLVSDKYYTIYIAVTIIALNLLNCYLAKVITASFRISLSGCCFSTPISSEDCSIIPYIAVSMTSPTSEDIPTSTSTKSWPHSATSQWDYPVPYPSLDITQTITISSDKIEMTQIYP